MKINTIRFPIGDWSDDGHGKCNYFLVTSNRPVNDVREAHFRCKEQLGFKIGDMCGEYEENTIDKDIVATLIGLGFTDPDGTCFNAEEYCSHEGLFTLWIKILMYIDPELELTPIVPDYEDINNWGFDDKGRHLDTPGYGLFE